MEEVTIDMPPQELSPNNPQETTQVQIESVPKDLSTMISPLPNPADEKKEDKPRQTAGRPCEFCKDQENILKITEEYIHSAIGDKPKMLYLGELAIKLDRDDETLTLWANKVKEDGRLEHPAFSALIKRLQSIQQLRLQQRLMGRYNPTGAIFLLKTKHKYIETEKQILLGEKNADPIQIEFISEKQLPQDE